MAIPMILLVGGKGERLKSLELSQAMPKAMPKAMMDANGKPFLLRLLRRYWNEGFRRFILCTGHQADAIEAFPWGDLFPGAELEFSRESAPLGTGGAARAAFERYRLDEAWIVNGDTWLESALDQAIPSCASGIDARFTVLDPANVFDAEPNLAIAGDRIAGPGPHTSNNAFDAGATYVSKAAIDRSPLRAGSLHELLEPTVRSGRAGYSRLAGTCYDIGTPKRYARFREFGKEARLDHH